METPYCIGLITIGSHDEAQKLAKGLIQNKLAACVNIMSNIESIYQWQGNIECEKEYLLICKTTQSCWSQFEQWVLSNHPYDTPEIIQLPITAGSTNYLNWIQNCIKN